MPESGKQRAMPCSLTRFRRVLTLALVIRPGLAPIFGDATPEPQSQSQYRISRLVLPYSPCSRPQLPSMSLVVRSLVLSFIAATALSALSGADLPDAAAAGSETAPVTSIPAAARSPGLRRRPAHRVGPFLDPSRRKLPPASATQ